MTRRILSIVLCIIVLAACSSASTDSAPQASRVPPAATVIDPQLKALQDAKAVQATLDEAEKKRSKQLEEAGG